MATNKKGMTKPRLWGSLFRSWRPGTPYYSPADRDFVQAFVFKVRIPINGAFLLIRKLRRDGHVEAGVCRYIPTVHTFQGLTICTVLLACYP